MSEYCRVKFAGFVQCLKKKAKKKAHVFRDPYCLASVHELLLIGSRNFPMK